MQHCPHCGERVYPDDAYCFECGTELGDRSDERDSPPREQHRAPTDSRRHGRGENADADAPGRNPDADVPGPARGPGREPARGQHPAQASTPGRVESLTTLWVAAVLAVVSLLENAAVILYAEEVVELLRNEGVGFAERINAGSLVVPGALGIVIALAVAGVCAYYYRQGYVDRSFFWLLIVMGVAGLFLAGGLSVILLILVGAYGLLTLRRDRPERPVSGVGRR